MSHCCLCGVLITPENDTKEHVIPNAIGGRLKVKGFICNRCNSLAGETWDRALLKQVESLCLLLDIKRERGQVQPMVTIGSDGQKYILHPGGRISTNEPTVEVTPSQKKLDINVTARTEGEGKKILKGIVKKYPWLDLDTLLNEAKSISSYSPSNLGLQVQFGDPNGIKSSIKTALAYAKILGADIAECNLALEVINGRNDRKIFGYDYKTDYVADRPKDTVFHCINVVSNPSEKILYAYLEYFSCYRLFILLSENYQGMEINDTYAIDPTIGEELHLKVNCELSAHDLEIILQSIIDPEDVKRPIAEVYAIAYKGLWEREMIRAVSHAVYFAAEKLEIGDDEDIPEEKWQQFVKLLMQDIQPFTMKFSGVPAELIPPVELDFALKKKIEAKISKE
ncbi:HNH endonuclease, partial [Curvivirga aplysinae]|uniref:HNH endonuclease n=1 Tax=Curvivirga aplysinae TaxID=2529852 RepID=UPI001C3F6FE9